MKEPTTASLQREITELTARVDRLEKARAADLALAPRHLELQSTEHAMREALLQFTQEIAAREGIPVEQFNRVFIQPQGYMTRPVCIRD